jgi:hypothetical protein
MEQETVTDCFFVCGVFSAKGTPLPNGAIGETPATSDGTSQSTYRLRLSIALIDCAFHCVCFLTSS